MTRRQILRKYGFCYMSNVNLDETITGGEQEKFEDLVRGLRDCGKKEDKIIPWPIWKERLYKKFVGRRT